MDIFGFLHRLFIGRRHALPRNAAADRDETVKSAPLPDDSDVVATAARPPSSDAPATPTSVPAVKVTETEAPRSTSQKTSPTAFHGNGPSWATYSQTLWELDRHWRANPVRKETFAVFGPQPSWENTIERAQPLFQLETWEGLSEDQLKLMAPTHYFADGNALLGSIMRRNKATNAFIASEERSGDREKVRALLRDVQTRPLQALRTGAAEAFAELCAIDGFGPAFATRLLALARPDGFIVLNNKSGEWLRAASGLSFTNNKRLYPELIQWLWQQEWYLAPEPGDPDERRAWKLRAALLDAYAYHPDDSAPKRGPGRPRKAQVAPGERPAQ